MNNIAYNKAKEHLKDFTKFPSINDIVLLMEMHAKDVSIEFAFKFVSKTTISEKFMKEQYEQFLKEQENE